MMFGILLCNFKDSISTKLNLKIFFGGSHKATHISMASFFILLWYLSKRFSTHSSRRLLSWAA